MIKRFLFLALAVTTLSLTACGSQELSEPLTRNFETTQGELHSLGVVKVNEVVTHLFETSDGQILYAYSTRYDLDTYGEQTLEAYGVLTTYEELDKALFEIKRLTVLDEATQDDVAAVQEIYSSTSLGVKFPVLSSWKVTSSGDLLSFELPLPPAEEEVSALTEKLTPDVIDVIRLTGDFGLSLEASTEERLSAVEAYVQSNDMTLSGVVGEKTQIGSDQLPALKYKLESGDLYVFIPRGEELFELSYHFLSEDETLRIEHSNRFSTLLNGFRFISADEPELETDAADVSEDLSSSDEESVVTQVKIDKFASFTSNGYGFSMDYPANWYYIGGSTGYLFDLQEFEDTAQNGLLKLTMNAVASAGVRREAGRSYVTVKEASRTYTLEGPSEYEDLMQTMLSSIETTKTE